MKIPDVIFSAGFDRALAWTMLHSIWQATLIAILTGLVLYLLRRHSARVRYAVANLALVAVLLTSAGTFLYYFQEVRVLSRSAEVKPQLGTAASFTAVANQLASAEMVAKVRSATAAKSPGRTGLRVFLSKHLPLIVSVWFTGMALFLCRLLGSFTQVYYLRREKNFPADPYWLDLLDKLAGRSGYYTGVQLLESALVRSPLTIGHLKPIILFPIGLINRLTEAEVEAVLAHELAHILRRDYIFNLLQSLVEAVFYFHPAVWWLSSQIRQERESACDDQAITLLGNKIMYAKALVSIQEMAFYPPAPALAFAGNKRNQLLVRIQRLFSPPTTKFNIMEKWIATGLVVCSLVAIAFGQHLGAHTSNQSHKITKSAQPHLSGTNTTESKSYAHNSGIWEATFSGDSVCMTFSSQPKDDHWVTGECFFRSNFTNLNVMPGETAFQLIRPAGQFNMTGKMENNNSGYGRFEFVPNESYRTTLSQQGIDRVDDELLLHCFFANLPANYVGFLKKQGYDKVSREDLLQLAVFRINEVALRGYLDIAASMGKQHVPLHDLIEMKVANVGPENVTQLAKVGYKDLDMEEVTQLALLNVEPLFIDSMNAMGFGKLSVEELITAKVQGLHTDLVQQYQSAGLGKISFDDLITLQVQHINLDFINQYRQAGLGELSVENLTSAKVVGLTTDFVKQYKDLGFDLNFEELVSAKVQNIDPRFIAQCQNMELGELSMEDILNMKIHGIDAALVRQYHQMDIGPVSLENLMSIRIHNITPEFVKPFHGLFAKLTIDDVMSARIHGVTPEFIKETEAKGYKFPTLEEYAGFKVGGQGKGRRAE